MRGTWGRVALFGMVALAASTAACGPFQAQVPAATSSAPTTAAPLPIPDGSYDDVRDVNACDILQARWLTTVGTPVDERGNPAIVPICGVELKMDDLPKPIVVSAAIVSYQDSDFTGLATVDLGSGTDAHYPADCVRDTIGGRAYTVPEGDGLAVQLMYGGDLMIHGEDSLDPSVVQPFCDDTLAVTKALAPVLSGDLPRYPDGAVPDVDTCAVLSTLGPRLFGSGFLARGDANAREANATAVPRDPRFACSAGGDTLDTVSVAFTPDGGAVPAEHQTTVDGQQISIGMTAEDGRYVSASASPPDATSGMCVAQWNPNAKQDLAVKVSIFVSEPPPRPAPICPLIMPLVTAEVDAFNS